MGLGKLGFAMTHTKPGIPNDLHPNCPRVMDLPEILTLFLFVVLFNFWY